MTTPRPLNIALSLDGHRSAPIVVPINANKLNAHVQATTWGTAVVEIKWSITDELDESIDGQWVSFTTARTLSSSSPALENVSVTGKKWIIFEVTTADGTADGNAPIEVSFV